MNIFYFHYRYSQNSLTTMSSRFRLTKQETAAAVKVQAAYRRNKVMDDLEAQGVSTTASRNRSRRRRARKDLQVSDDTPSLFRCCGLGLAL